MAKSEKQAKSKSKSREKKPLTEAKLAANQENAKHSTGPKSEEGKARARMNSLKHGMCARVVPVIEGEDRERYDAEKRAWVEASKATNDIQLALAAKSFDAFWRAERCMGVETAVLSQQVRHATKNYAREQIATLEKLTRQIGDDPLGTLCELRNTVAGCDWIIAKFRWLKATLDERGWWYPSENELAFNLFGKRVSDAFAADTFASELLDAYVITAWTADTATANWRRLGISRPEAMNHDEYQLRLTELIPEVFRDEYDVESMHIRREQLFAKKELSSMIQAELERVIAQREQIDALEQHDRADAGTIAAFDSTREGMLRLRYEMGHRRTMHVALADLVRQQALAKDDPDPPAPLEFDEPPQDAPLLDVTLLTEPDHFVDPRPRPMGNEVRIDRPPQSEPIITGLRERKPLIRKRFRNAAWNVPGVNKAPSIASWCAADIIVDDTRGFPWLTPYPILMRSSVSCELSLG